MRRQPSAMGLAAVPAPRAPTPALTRPRPRSLRALGAQLARRFHLHPSADARAHHHEEPHP